MNAGLIASLVVHARVNTQGSLETPFYKISEISREEGIIHLSAGEDEYHRIAMGNFLALGQRTQKVHVTSVRYR
jgi:DNA-directed RNA polymerase subunit beta